MNAAEDRRMTEILMVLPGGRKDHVGQHCRSEINQMMVLVVPHPSEIELRQIVPSQFKQKRLFAFIVAAQNTKIVVPTLLKDSHYVWQYGELNI